MQALEGKKKKHSMLSPRVQNQDTQTHIPLGFIKNNVDTVLTAVTIVSVLSFLVVVMPDIFYLPSHLVLTTAQRTRVCLVVVSFPKEMR